MTKGKKEKKRITKMDNILIISLFNALTSMFVKMYNYVVGEDSNIVNQSDDLSFLHYIKLVKYLCNIEIKEYLEYKGNDSFKKLLYS